MLRIYEDASQLQDLFVRDSNNYEYVEIMRSLPPYIRQLNRHSLRNPILEDSGTIN